jgi:hypothetical protein
VFPRANESKISFESPMRKMKIKTFLRRTPFLIKNIVIRIEMVK